MSVGRKRLLLVLVSAIVSLELILQLGHLATVFLVQNKETADDDRQVVLCVGDSFTFGLGASDVDEFSYPAALQRVLDERQPGKWRVVNRGHPGRNSRQLLERIDALVEREQPDQVLILLGLNDRWSAPERLELADLDAAKVDDDRGFRLEWRTRRLVLLALNAFRDDSPTEPQALRIATVEPFTPRLDSEDPALRADRDGAVSELAGAPLLEARPTGPLGESGSDLPVLRALATKAEGSVRADALVRAFVLTGDRERFRAAVLAEPQFGPPVLHEVCESLELSRAELEEVRAVYADALGWRQADGMWVHPELGRQHAFGEMPKWVAEGQEVVDLFATLESHLQAIAGRCQERGAAVRFLGYPNETGVPDLWYRRRLEVEHGLRFVPTSPRFAEVLGGQDPSMLFIEDGHCNDRGYQLMAEIAADSLLGQ